jgi:hypothetical protein
MSDPTIKQLTVTGNAAESFLNKGGSRRRRRSSANKTQRNEVPVVGKQQGGTSPGTIVQIQANRAPDAPALGPDAVSQAKASNSSALAKTTTNSTSASSSAPAPSISPQVAAAASAQGGGKEKKTVKVILAGGKKKDTKVILSPTKVKKLPGAPQQVDKAKTRKVAKKIRVSLHGLNKRVTRANHIRKEATKQPIADVKKTLITAKLIKETSKAPEDILRKMYADYMMLKNRAL